MGHFGPWDRSVRTLIFKLCPVVIYKLSDEDTFLLCVSEICLKLLTMVSLLILSNTSLVIVYYSICVFYVNLPQNGEQTF